MKIFILPLAILFLCDLGATISDKDVFQVNGGWSDWVAGDCTSGMRTDTRTCNYPLPSWEGVASCDGESTREVSCTGDSNYKTTAKGSMCSDLNKEITSATECKEAASKLGLNWALAWNGPNDFPGCLYAQDGRNLVYFNASPKPARENLNPKYSAICKGTTYTVLSSKFFCENVDEHSPARCKKNNVPNCEEVCSELGDSCIGYGASHDGNQQGVTCLIISPMYHKCPSGWRSYTPKNYHGLTITTESRDLKPNPYYRGYNCMAKGDLRTNNAPESSVVATDKECGGSEVQKFGKVAHYPDDCAKACKGVSSMYSYCSSSSSSGFCYCETSVETTGKCEMKSAHGCTLYQYASGRESVGAGFCVDESGKIDSMSPNLMSVTLDKTVNNYGEPYLDTPTCHAKCQSTTGCTAFVISKFGQCNLYSGGPYTGGNGDEDYECFVMTG